MVNDDGSVSDLVHGELWAPRELVSSDATTIARRGGCRARTLFAVGAERGAAAPGRRLVLVEEVEGHLVESTATVPRAQLCARVRAPVATSAFVPLPRKTKLDVTGRDEATFSSTRIESGKQQRVSFARSGLSRGGRSAGAAR